MSIPILAMCSFALSMSASPGPVNLLILSQSLSLGWRKTLPLVSGATLGFIALLSLLATTAAALSPLPAQLLQAMNYLALLYTFYLAGKIALADVSQTESQAQAASFSSGMLLQTLNPKAWLAGLAGISLFSQASEPTNIWIFVALYFLICYAALAAWAILGAHASRILRQPRQLRRLNQLMAGLLILSGLINIWHH